MAQASIVHMNISNACHTTIPNFELKDIKRERRRGEKSNWLVAGKGQREITRPQLMQTVLLSQYYCLFWPSYVITHITHKLFRQGGGTHFRCP